MQVLTDGQWAKFEAAITAANIRGVRSRVEDQRTVEAVIGRLDNSTEWRSIPAEFGDWHHAYLRFRRWAVRGGWDKIMAHLWPRGSHDWRLPASTGRSLVHIKRPPVPEQAKTQVESATHSRCRRSWRSAWPFAGRSGHQDCRRL